MIRESTGYRNFLGNSGGKSSFDTNGRIALYTGALPATGDTAMTGTLLGTFTLAATAQGTYASGASTFAAVSNVTAAAAGTAASFIIYNSVETAPTSAAIATDKRLVGRVAQAFSTTLNGAVATGATTLTVPSTTGFPASGTLLLNGVDVTYTGVTATTFTGCSNVVATATAAAVTTADLIFDNPTFTSGQTLALTTFVLTNATY